MGTYSNYPGDGSDQDFSSAAEPQSAAGERASESLSFARAVQGRPGGPWFQPSTPGTDWGAGLPPWQWSQRLWRESGIPWDVPITAESLVPKPRYQGRHTRAKAPAVPLSAPVFTSQPPA